MKLKITTLVENTKGEHLSLENEHGFSAYIEYDGCKILFDTGQSDNYIKNAEKLNIDLSKTMHVVLSHGHYDHSGGFRYFAEKYGNQFVLHVGKKFFLDKYAFDGVRWEYLGNDFDEQYLKEKEIHFVYTGSELEEIAPGAYLVSNFTRTTDFEKINKRFYIYKNNEYIPDTFSDEISLVLDTEKGLVLIVGCSHPGIVNICETVKSKLGKKIYGIIGGTHLVEASDEQIDLTFKYFEEMEIELMGLSHCSGQKAVEQARKWKGKFFQNCTGAEIILK